MSAFFFGIFAISHRKVFCTALLIALGEAAVEISNEGAEGSFTFSSIFHLEALGYSGGGLI